MNELERILFIGDALERIEARVLTQERRTSEIIGVLVSAGLWKVDTQTGRSAPQGPYPSPDGTGRPCVRHGWVGCTQAACTQGLAQGPYASADGTEGLPAGPERSTRPELGEGGKGRGSPARDPVVSKDPPRWKGRSYVGTRWSATSSEYMRATEAFLAWCFDRAEENGEKTAKGDARAPFIWKDILLARHWAVDLLTREEAAKDRGPK